MRIICQKCATAYVIDDKLIKPKGVRAQCPRCRHTQLVTRTMEMQAATEAELQPASEPALAPVSAPAPALPASPARTPVAPLLAPLEALEFAPEPAPADEHDPLLEFLGGQSAPPVAQPPSPARAATPAASAQPRAATPPPEPEPDASFLPFDAPASEPRCSICGKPLADEFDQVLGACESCRSKESTVTARVDARENTVTQRVDTRESMQALQLEDTHPRVPAPQFEDTRPGVPMPQRPDTRESMPPPQRPAPRESNPLPPRRLEPASQSAEPAPDSRPSHVAPAGDASAGASSGASRLGRLKPAPAGSEESRGAARAEEERTTRGAVSASARRDEGGGLSWKVMAAVGVVLLAGGGAAAFFLRGGSSAQSPSAPAAGESQVPEGLLAVVQRWQSRVPAGGDASQLLTEGNRLLAKEQQDAYVQALTAFQRAVVLNPRNDAAIAGYVQALALVSGSRLEDAAFQEALGLVRIAKARSNGRPVVLLAHANLLLTRPSTPESTTEVRKMAEQVLEVGTPTEKAEAHLVLGRLFLSSSWELAGGHLQQALALEPKLARVHHYRALALEAGGNFSEALKSLEQRRKADERNSESLEGLARIYAEVGDVPRARKVYEELLARSQNSQNNLPIHLPLAVLRYQAEGKAAEAVLALRGMLRHRERQAPDDIAEVLLHLATAERLAGKLQDAAKAAREALELKPDMTPAALQLFLVQLAQGAAADAASSLDSLRGRLGDAALEQVLEGRLRLLERKPDEALKLFQEAERLDNQRGDALLLAGVAAAQAGRRDEAFRFLFKALQSDPARLAPRERVLTRFYLRPGETVQDVGDAIGKLASGRDDVVPLLYEGLLRFHQGELPAAERLMRKVAEEDFNNAHAFAYRALIALQKRDMAQARSLSERAVAVGRSTALAYLARGLVLAEDARQGEQAKRALREALALAPGLLSAEVKLAELEARGKEQDSARSRLVKVLGLDPSYRAARRALFLMDTRG